MRPAPTPAQRRICRELWPSARYIDIAKAASVNKDTLRYWREAGLLGELPRRYVTRGRRTSSYQPARRSETKQSRNLDRGEVSDSIRRAGFYMGTEPLTDCKPCHLCQYEDVCRARGRAGLWVLCETPDERALEVVRAVMEVAG